MNLLMTEMRRALHRRAVRVLIAIALAGCALAGAIAYFASKGKTVAQLRLAEDSPAVMANWWIADDHVGVLSVGMFFLFLGGFFGGATVAGARMARRHHHDRAHLGTPATPAPRCPSGQWCDPRLRHLVRTAGRVPRLVRPRR